MKQNTAILVLLVVIALVLLYARTRPGWGSLGKAVHSGGR